MIWIKLPEIEVGTDRAHYFAYCWACQRSAFMPGMFLTSQLYLNPYVHTEPICEKCARACDPNFGNGAKLELIDGKIEVTKGDEPECGHEGPKRPYSVLPDLKVVWACSYPCAKELGGEIEE